MSSLSLIGSILDNDLYGLVGSLIQRASSFIHEIIDCLLLISSLKSQEFQTILKENIELIEKLAADLKTKHPDVIDFHRNTGMSMGIGIKDPVSAEDATFKILYRAYQRGLLVISLCGTILRIQPPLNIKKEELTRGFEIISESIVDYQNGDIPDSVFDFRAGW